MKWKSLLLTFGFSVTLLGQSLEREIISTTGDHMQNSQVNVSWTLGETFTESLSNSSVQVNQGFHHPRLDAIGILERISPIHLKIYPVPFTNQLTITDLPKENVQLSLHQIDGKKILELDSEKLESLQLDLSELSAGEYLLQVNIFTSKQQSTYKLLKIN